MTTTESLHAAVEACDPLALLALADALEEDGNPLARGLREMIARGRLPRVSDPHYGAQHGNPNGDRPCWVWMGEGDSHYPASCYCGELNFHELKDYGEAGGDRKFYPTRVGAVLALARVLSERG